MTQLQLSSEPVPFPVPNFRLDGKVAIITGASRGIGEAIAQAMAHSGACTVLASRDQARLEAVAAKIGSISASAHVVKADICKADDVARLVAETVERFGRIDVLVNNAGVCYMEPALEVTPEAWDKTFDLNVRALFFLSQAVARQMVAQERGGKIINVASQLAVVGMARHSSYCASKAAVHLLTQVLALEWGKYHIHVNAIGPTFIRTEMAAPNLDNPTVRADILSKMPIGHVGDPVDVAGAAVFLASAASEMVTGELLLVDGGWTAQ
ncbi:MAG: glucose 1-dehydrogenase [Chloroflexi bacterium]|nr:glucose 1-dehydrogenase [Chloroflexota bacterium]